MGTENVQTSESSGHFITWWILVAAIVCTIVLFGSTNKDSQSALLEASSASLKKCSIDFGGERGSDSSHRIPLCMWLQDVDLLHLVEELKQIGLRNLDDVHELDDAKVNSALGKDADRWKNARLTVPLDMAGFEKFVNNLEQRARNNRKTNPATNWLWGSKFFKGLAIIVCAAISYLQIKHYAPQWLSFLSESYHYALASKAQVDFHWEEPCMVGNIMSFTVRFNQRWSGNPYPISDADAVRISVRHGASRIAVAVEIGGVSLAEANQVKASFTVRKAGQYSIDILLGSIPIRGSPFVKRFLPGPAEASKTTRFHPTSMAVCTAGVAHPIILEPRDEYGNQCSWANDPSGQEHALENFALNAFLVGSQTPVHPLVQWTWVEVMHRLLIHVTFESEGIYMICLKLNNGLISKGDFNIIVLSRGDASTVAKARESKSQMFETKLISINGEKWTKNKKVFCALSPKQMAFKEYILGLFPKRLATFRLCPSTKFTFNGSSNQHDALSLVIEDGSQLKVEIVSKEAHFLAASFAHYLSKNIGGSESFTDKQNYFYQEIRKFHQKKSHDKLILRIERETLLQSSMRLTKNFNTSDWCRNFEIVFIGEQGLDWGGLRREWIELLCVEIFDRKRSGMFISFSEDPQALVHPNLKMPANCRLKHYQFAGKIVGKCLYESSLGASFRQLVKAHFTRSFLAQLIGLRVTYKYFEQDDPQLYLSKIKYIEENDVADMELTFSEEEYDEKGRQVGVIELIPDGARIAVNNQNKYRYLDALAQHRLVNSVKDQVEAFIEGLNELVPDNLLSIFDENELELLVCGTSEYNVAQLKAQHVVVGSSPEFRKVLSWFWTAVTNFGPEELSRLLQFTTGSSQLPSGGLAELSPKLQIVASPSFGSLPTAHTCFNQLCLPDYETYENFEKALLLAINEGSEGFGLV